MYIEKIENLLTSLSVVRYKSYNRILFGGLFKSVNNKYTDAWFYIGYRCFYFIAVQDERRAI